MTGPEPRLALALLRRFVPDNEPLVGDLLEGFAVRKSRLWLWREVFLAIAIRAFQARDENRPLGLSHASFVPAEHARDLHGPRRINLTASPLRGVGGLSFVVLGAIMALVRPQILWLFVPAIIGGAAFGLTMVIVRRRGGP